MQIADMIDVPGALRRGRSLDRTIPDPEPERLGGSKPRWAKSAVRKAEFAPEINKPGTRFTPPIPRGQGRRNRFAAT